MASPLPTPREAMTQEIERAQLGEYDAARFWLDAARELRQGSQRPAWDDLDLLGDDVGPPIRWGGPGSPSLPTPAGETVVMERSGVAVPEASELPRCGHCGHMIQWVSPGPADGSGRMPAWRHLLTNQEVCPVSAPDQPHTYATPRVDG